MVTSLSRCDLVVVLLSAFVVGCSGSGGSGSTDNGLGGSGGGHATTSSSGSTGGGKASGAGGAGGGLSGPAGGGGAAMTPVRMIPNLASITFYETTGMVNAYTFQVDGPELTTHLGDPLADGNEDIAGAGTEYYDVYYSDIDGTFNLDGSYLTISGVFEYALPAGGGLNLAEIALNYTGKPTEYGNYVASFVALGDNAAPADVDKCIDGDLNTCTTMGNTIGSNERLRLTLGFQSSSGPPPK